MMAHPVWVTSKMSKLVAVHKGGVGYLTGNVESDWMALVRACQATMLID